MLLSWLTENQPDILCLQETKQVNEKFEHDAFSANWLPLLSQWSEDL